MSGGQPEIQSSVAYIYPLNKRKIFVMPHNPQKWKQSKIQNMHISSLIGTHESQHWKEKKGHNIEQLSATPI